MTLLVSRDELRRIAHELRQAGVTSVEASFRGPLVQHTDGVDVPRAVVALRRLADRLARIDGKDGRRQFMDLLEKEMK